jgi:hypothetical protein
MDICETATVNEVDVSNKKSPRPGSKPALKDKCRISCFELKAYKYLICTQPHQHRGSSLVQQKRLYLKNPTAKVRLEEQVATEIMT